MSDYEKVGTREEFVAYVRDLLNDLENGERYWQNGSLEPFLEALAHWTEKRMPEYWEREGKNMPDNPTWRALAELLYVGAVYE